MLQDIFVYNNQINRVELNIPEILLVREFSKLLDPSRNKCKQDPKGTKGLRAFREFTYIWLAICWKSIYADYDEQERHQEALKDAQITEEEFNDPDFRAACRKFREIQESNKSVRLLQSATNMVDKFIDYFNEITGYIPLNEECGLDFDPSWFTEARDTFIRTGHYCEYRRGSKAYTDFWKEQYRRCKYGLTVNGYTVTGDHYYFLNFYRLKDLVNVQEAGGGRGEIFPNFLEGQYQWFHYLKLARILKMNALMMKARETGYSEIEASILAKSYTVIKGSINVCSAYAGVQLDKLWEKIDHNL